MGGEVSTVLGDKTVNKKNTEALDNSYCNSLTLKVGVNHCIYQVSSSPLKAPGQQGIADTHTRPSTDTALPQSHHSRAP